MKPIYHFEKAKFLGLNSLQQHNAFINILRHLEEQACLQNLSPELIEMVEKMANWMDIREFSSLEGSSPRDLALAAADWLIKNDRPVRDEDIPIYQHDGEAWGLQKRESASQMVVILSSLRSAFNTGSIFRTAECLGIAELWLCGITPKPGERALEKTARDTVQRVKWRVFDNTRDAVSEAKAQGRTIYALETAGTARQVFTMEYQFPNALILGNEALGIDKAILDICDHIISIPVQGWKNSLNVGVAFAVCAYQMIWGCSSAPN